MYVIIYLHMKKFTAVIIFTVCMLTFPAPTVASEREPATCAVTAEVIDTKRSAERIHVEILKAEPLQLSAAMNRFIGRQSNPEKCTRAQKGDVFALQAENLDIGDVFKAEIAHFSTNGPSGVYRALHWRKVSFVEPTNKDIPPPADEVYFSSDLEPVRKIQNEGNDNKERPSKQTEGTNTDGFGQFVRSIVAAFISMFR